jgi:hypothetical protein
MTDVIKEFMIKTTEDTRTVDEHLKRRNGRMKRTDVEEYDDYG